MSTTTTTSHTHPAVGDTFGQTILGTNYEYRIIAIAEGWAMVRQKYSRWPFCMEANALMATKEWQLHCPICKPRGCRD